MAPTRGKKTAEWLRSRGCRSLIGGVGVIVVALTWLRLFPALRGIERLTGDHVPDDLVKAE